MVLQCSCPKRKSSGSQLEQNSDSHTDMQTDTYRHTDSGIDIDRLTERRPEERQTNRKTDRQAETLWWVVGSDTLALIDVHHRTMVASISAVWM